MLSIAARDGFARIALWDSGGAALRTPEVLWAATPRVRPPDFARALLVEGDAPADRPAVRDLGSVFAPRAPGTQGGIVLLPPDLPYPPLVGDAMLQAAQAHNASQAGCGPGAGLVLVQPGFAHDAPLVALGHARARFAQPRQFAADVLQARRTAGPDALLYAPGLGLPHELAMLAYCGVDLADSVPAMLAARRGKFLTPEGALDGAALDERPCVCPACMSSGEGYAWLRDHNGWAVEAELRRVREAIRAQRLRELVEARVRAWPQGIALLRILDLEHHDAFAARAPVVRTGPMMLGSKESLWRPEVERFRRRLVQYRKPASARVLLLLPCSARKPYSDSRTHAILGKALSHVRSVEAVHRVVLTSPLGVVPMELELASPAAHYDLPVTGHWDRDERALVQQALRELLAHNAYDKIVVHLDCTERDLIAEVLPGAEHTAADDDPLSPKSLEALQQALRGALQDAPPVRWQQRARDDMAARATWQFGPGAEVLAEGGRIEGRYPHLKLLGPEGQRAMLTPERGLLSLTMHGAKLLQPLGRFQVEIDDFRPRGGILAPGVERASADIKPEDEVLVTHAGELRAVGKAVVSGEEMGQLRRGEVVKVRHHA
ncbi:MAG TPA: archaeosine synthase subunit alpha [Candidatus Thermoplasmatota archaeon]|jgi:archaeosine synthase|nr:archaeosine synthase subunit alpha [Candidatus Thermoplasmatota archaeon]